MTRTNYTPPVTHPLYCSPVYFQFVTNDTLTENGFSIIYREHPSPNFTSLQSLLRTKAETKVESQTSPPAANNTLFSLVLHQLDALIANNLLTAEQLEYVQSQLNDQLEDFSFQLASHVRTITNASCVPVNNTFTAYTPPFPFYEYVMLFLSSVSVLFFLLLTCCLSRRLYHLYIVPDKYRLGKYAHAMQILLILLLISPTCAKPLPLDNLFLALWKHVQWESNHGIFIPFLQYRPSEAFFEYTIFVFVLSTFCIVFYLLLSSKSGGRSPSPSSDSSMSCSTPTFNKRQSQASLLTLLSCGPNAKASPIPITNGTFMSLPVSIPDSWHYTSNISFD